MCGVAVTATPLSAQSQAVPSTATSKIAVFSSAPSADQALREGLRELGYVEGENIIIDWRPSLGTEEQLRAVASQVAREHVALIVVFSTSAARAALQATTLPVVFGLGDPVAAGLAPNLAQTDRATGVSLLNSELVTKRMQLLKQLLPTSRRMLYLMNSSSPLDSRMLENAKSAGATLGLEITTLNARSASELDSVLQTLSRDRSIGLLVSNDHLFLANKAKVTQAVRRTKHAAIFPFKEYHEDGALMSYGPNVRTGARKVASYVDKILKGARASQLPIEQISQQELVIDLHVAREMGIMVPPDLLLRADEVLQ
jgi:putative ABC transport system substrate-binding protein